MTELATSLYATAKQKQQDVIDACWNTPSFKTLVERMAYDASSGAEDIVLLTDEVDELLQDVAAVEQRMAGKSCYTDLPKVFASKGFSYRDNTVYFHK